MNGFDKRREEKNRAIIAAAFELFNKNGVDATRITDIAKKAGVSKVSIYNYSGSKEELARQVLYAFMDKKLSEFRRFMDSNLSFKEKFDILYKLKIDSAEVLHESLYSYKFLLSPKMKQFINTYYETKTRPLFIKLIEQGKREGDIDSNLSNEALITYLEAFKDMTSLLLNKKQLIDLAKLVFYGFRGQ
ncbi:MAG: TetR/AcrR family transcriptional regulator [Firmicutes bacterium]|nr:TetR/AcrR family transcriptional regulator [Bacillota bacterium]